MQRQIDLDRLNTCKDSLTTFSHRRIVDGRSVKQKKEYFQDEFICIVLQRRLIGWPMRLFGAGSRRGR